MNEVDATPAKRFFVEMLIRDIGLKDAILDLLDNCLDGAMRKQAGKTQDPPYANYWAKISLDANSFSLEDNCGGIPPVLAEKSAFRLGRHESDVDADLPTVGVYGIGMKRAVFKMGRNATIDSHHPDGQFTVAIDRNWMESDGVWKIPVKENVTALEHHGVRIHVSELREGISRQFSDETGFVSDLEREIADYYGYIIEKGFEVSINGKLVQPTQVSLLISNFNGRQINPFVYETEFDGVEVSVAVGFYRDLPSAEEEDASLQGRPSTERAGISIICNDRVVTFADKTRLTGWGTGTVPQYHTQFVSIAGIVTFKSNDASKLPLTTTKRGLDGSSDLYLGVREYVQEGLKQFTDFTNKWKNAPTEKAELSSQAQSVAARSIAAQIPPDRWSTVQKGLGGKKFKPVLPLPVDENPHRQIRFSRPLSDVKRVASYLFDDEAVNPSNVGGKCFDDVLKGLK